MSNLMAAKTCQICHRNILSHSITLDCKHCKESAHIACYNVQRSESQDITDWMCRYCLSDAMPYLNIDDESIFREVIHSHFSDQPLDFDYLNNLIFNPFETNDTSLPISDFDPDVQYYSDTCFSHLSKCEYYLIENFNEYKSNTIKTNAGLSIYHHNIRSLPRHFTDMQTLLEGMGYMFDFIGLTESWLNATNNDLFAMEGYHIPCQKFRESRKGGGVILYIKETVTFKERADIDFTEGVAESIFVEIHKDVYQTQKHIVIGVIYRPPNTNISIFNEEFGCILDNLNKENKLLYMMADYNIDLLKDKESPSTGEFLDILYRNHVVPLITKPTRNTNRTATLIDNILTNNISDTHSQHQGLIYTDLTDHYPLFHINTSMQDMTVPIKYIWKRKINARSITLFINSCKEIYWSSVNLFNSAQEAYSWFHGTLNHIYNKHFPLTKSKISNYKSRQP